MIKMTCKSELRHLINEYGLNFVAEAMEEVEADLADEALEESMRIAADERNEYISEADKQ
jgi:N-methylhydantoinase B/oxoprolinase/acetone carboxylase alpha subunit